jgi:hypothetical protein
MSALRSAHRSAEYSIPFTLLWLQSRDTQELVYGLLGIIGLHLLRIVVFVLDVDVSSFLLFIIVLIVKVVARRISKWSSRSHVMESLLLLVRVLHEIVVVRHSSGARIEFRSGSQNVLKVLGTICNSKERCRQDVYGV